MRLGPVSRISMGLISLAAFLLLVADLIFGLLPDEADVAKHVRKRTSEALAVQMTALVQTEQWEALRRTMHAVISRDPEVLSIAVRRNNGEVVAETGNHAAHCVRPANDKSTLTNVLVPIDSGRETWGRLEVAYRPTTPQTLLGWLEVPGRGADAADADGGVRGVLPVPQAHPAAPGSQRRDSRPRAHRLRRAVRRGSGDRQARAMCCSPTARSAPCILPPAGRAHRQAHQGSDLVDGGLRRRPAAVDPRHAGTHVGDRRDDQDRPGRGGSGQDRDQRRADRGRARDRTRLSHHVRRPVDG